MPFFPISQDDMTANALKAMREHTNISQLSPGGKTRFLLDSMIEEQVGQHLLFDDNMSQSFIRWAEDKYLDFFGDMLNIPRLQADTAEVFEEDNNFMFFVDSGTFGDINGGNSISIPSGNIISNPQIELERRVGQNSDGSTDYQVPRIIYELTNTVTCPASASYVYCRIRARIEGSGSDVSRNVLVEHNFSGYIKSSTKPLKCINKYSIASGRERESDASYKYRLMNAFKARERANRYAIRLAALSIPGVSDIIEVTCEQGPGTYSLYVLATTPTTSPRLVKKVRDTVELVSSFGIRPYVLAPSYLGLELVIAVKWKPTTTEEQKQIGYDEIRGTLEEVINGLSIGEELFIDELESIVTTSVTYLQGIGLSAPGKFEEVFLYRGTSDNTGVKKVVTRRSEIRPLYNEKIILETSTKDQGIIFL